MAEITEEQKKAMFETLDSLIHRTKCEAFNLASHFHDGAEEKGNDAAAALYNKAAEQLCAARDAIEAAKAFFTWADDQMDIGPFYSVTALTEPEEPKMVVQPTTRFWAGPPVWEVLNAPFQGMQNGSWFFYINEDAKMMGTLEVCAFIDDDEVPVLLGIEMEGEDERRNFTPAQWAYFIIPRVTKYREAMTTIQEATSVVMGAGSPEYFRSLKKRSVHEWAADRPTAVPGIVF